MACGVAPHKNADDAAAANGHQQVKRLQYPASLLSCACQQHRRRLFDFGEQLT
jgi:hypothetical protein